MRSIFYLLFLGVALLTLAIVVRSGMMLSKHPGEPISAAMRAAMAETSPQYSTEDANRIRALFPTAYSEPSGLMYVNRGSGEGPSPKIGDTVTANYSGRLLDGTPFDNSAAHGGPFKFQVGVAGVIKGWDESFLTMKRGARRTLIIPYWLGYGESGQPPTIPPRATLIFDVELVDFH
ncbi:MAG TPA: FKBP-type peptidyl-prolyl cis-trans isomerase [Opitutaceae bacterium]|jgi:FKBP-type peptidyl-prolyl cis-trans isomerase|nr:FKBP-type peptidyl-prolyl cis-trans isomerase [Opitutaceae bacterium]